MEEMKYVVSTRGMAWVLSTLAAGIAVLFLQAAPAWAANITVNATNDAVDANPGNGVCAAAGGNCTLRAAIMEANANNQNDTINVPAGTYTLTIQKGFDEDDLFGRNDAVGDLDILDEDELHDVNIVGAGARTTTVRGGEDFDDRIFDIPGLFTLSDPPELAPSSSVVNISGLTVTGGDASIGGGIRNIGTLTLSQSTVTGNDSIFDGGGIRNDNTLTVQRSTISDNTVTGGEAGPSGSLGGGGLLNNADATLVNTTISGNFAEFSGGGITNFGLGAELTSTNVTITANSANLGANFANLDDGITPLSDASEVSPAFIGPANFLNTIISNPQGGGNNCAGPTISDGNNLASDGSCGFGRPSDKENTNPRLGALANNGGPTNTHALLAASPAIDAANTAAGPNVDQRGVARPQDGDGNGSRISDIGAFERLGAPEPQNPNACTITGTPGNDILRGTPGRDVICGLGGNDIIYGLGGNDILIGNAGNDILRGGGGGDTLIGLGGNDVLRGGTGNDNLVGGPGNDALKGEGGNDRLDARDGVRGNDIADGGSGRDACRADQGDIKKNCP